MRGRLVYSTRWEDDTADRQDRILVQVVITNEAHEERMAALSRRPSLASFLRREARSRPALS